ncbi:MAG: hypothetical protein WC575_01975 [Patescibacteria group bacterium]
MWEWFTTFFTWSRLFSSYAPKFQDYTFKIIVGVIIGLVVVGIIFKIISAIVKTAPVKKLYRRLGTLFITSGVFYCISLLFTQTSTPMLGARWWFVLWTLVAIIWLGYILRYALWRLPKEIVQGKERQEFEKYLPKKY